MGVDERLGRMVHALEIRFDPWLRPDIRDSPIVRKIGARERTMRLKARGRPSAAGVTTKYSATLRCADCQAVMDAAL